MKDLKEHIREACFNLSTSLMWEKESLTVERIEKHMSELNEMTEKFYEKAVFYFENIEALEGNEQIIVRAINYIEEAHAIPPLRGNYVWFDYTLGTLIELACPNSRLSEKNLEFLNDIETGIKDYRDNSIEEDEF